MGKRRDKAAGRRRARAKPARGSGPATARSAVTSGPVDVTALTARELADLLGVPAATIRDHVKAGAPCAAGRPRRLSLIEYAAWLNKEVRTRGEAAR